MRIEQINIGHRSSLMVNRRELETGIFKERFKGAISVLETGLTGDAICNKKHHGGPDQAIYLYSAEDYSWWSDVLDQELLAGTFGENFTTSGEDLSEICVGDLLCSESVILQVSAPRIPCSVLASRMGDRGFAKRFMNAGRSGAYCRVLKIGEAKEGDDFTHKPYDNDRIPLHVFFKDIHSKLSADELKRYLSVPIDMRTRREFVKKLAAL